MCILQKVLYIITIIHEHARQISMKDHSSKISQILEIIDANEKFVLTTHINPDGDGLGSELALYYLLKKIGKTAHIINATPIPIVYRFLDEEEKLFCIYGEEHKNIIEEADVVFVLDISVLHRLGEVGNAIEHIDSIKVCIDHHASNSFEGDVTLIDVDAVATGELIYEVLQQGNFTLTPEMAQALYVAILTDTGCFRFSNTNARTHYLGAELLSLGVDHYDVYSRIYERNSWEKTILFARTFGDIKKAFDGKVAWMKITLDMFEQTGALYEDIEGFVEFPRNIDKVQISILFVERSDGKTKVSFRSSNQTSVDLLASEFGGGGHRNAAAAVCPGKNIDDVIERVLESSQKYLT